MDRPRIYCDFNKRYDRVTYGLTTVGTAQDVTRLGIALSPGLLVTLYDYDGFENRDPAWIVADGVVVTLPSGVLAAEVDPNLFRWEPCSDQLGSRPAV